MVTATFKGGTPTSSSAKMVAGGGQEDAVRLRVSQGGKFVMVSGLAARRLHITPGSRPAVLARAPYCCWSCAHAAVSPAATPQTEKAVWKYVGGDTFMHTVPTSWKYAELMFSLAEKVDGAVSVKYQLPGEELDPDSLISVSDDSDLQVRRRSGSGEAAAAGAGGRRYAGNMLLRGVERSVAV